MLKVLHIISDTNLGGAGQHVLTFLEHYDRSRLAVRVLCPPGALLVKHCAAAGVEVDTSPFFAGDSSFGWRGLAGLVREVGGLIKQHGIDVVHTHATFSGRLAARLAGVPGVVYTKHRMDWAAPGGELKSRAAAFLNRATCHRVIAVSRAVRESLVREGMPEEKIALIYNGIDVEKFRERAGRGLSPPLPEVRGKRVVGMVARLEPEKGHRHFLEAAALVLERRGDAVFVVAGTGSLAGALEKKAHRLGISDRVFFTGFREDIPQLIAALDVMVHPSLTEAFGISLVEGMCLGRPCVASAVGGLAEIAGTDGYAALLVPPGDAAALAGRIIFLLENPDAARAMGRRAAEMVRQKFDAGTMTEKITGLYYQIVDRA